MPYKVKIVKTETEPYVQSEWQKLSDTGGTDGGVKYGYAEKHTNINKETEVLSCVVDEINLEKVIDSIIKK